MKKIISISIDETLAAWLKKESLLQKTSVSQLITILVANKAKHEFNFLLYRTLGIRYKDTSLYYIYINNTKHLIPRAKNVPKNKEFENNYEKICIPLKGNDFFEIDAEFYNFLKSEFKELDVESELMKIKRWNFVNKDRRKTKKGIKRHINYWFEMAKNKKFKTDSYQQETSKSFDWEPTAGFYEE